MKTLIKEILQVAAVMAWAAMGLWMAFMATNEGIKDNAGTAVIYLVCGFIWTACGLGYMSHRIGRKQ